jgi:hypothetical protein
MGIRELVKRGKLTVPQALAQLNKGDGNTSHAYGWLLRRQEREQAKKARK